MIPRFRISLPSPPPQASGTRFPTFGIFRKPLQADPRRAGKTPTAVLPDGAYHQGRKLGSGQLWTQKHPPGTGKEDGSEGDQKIVNGKAQLAAQVAAMTQELSQKSK